MIYYPYSKDAVKEHELMQTTEFEICKRLDKDGWEGLSKEEKAILNNIYDDNYKIHLYKYGLLRFKGWIIVMPFIKTFWVKTQYDGIKEIKAYCEWMIYRNLVSKRSEIIHIEQVFY